jgi:hypothetical protein
MAPIFLKVSVPSDGTNAASQPILEEEEPKTPGRKRIGQIHFTFSYYLPISVKMATPRANSPMMIPGIAIPKADKP